MAKSPQGDEQYTEAETARRRDALLFKLLKTPPQSREELKGQRKPSRPKAASRKAKKSG
jgi:hypothetical protein